MADLNILGGLLGWAGGSAQYYTTERQKQTEWEKRQLYDTAMLMKKQELELEAQKAGVDYAKRSRDYVDSKGNIVPYGTQGAMPVDVWKAQGEEKRLSDKTALEGAGNVLIDPATGKQVPQGTQGAVSVNWKDLQDVNVRKEANRIDEIKASKVDGEGRLTDYQRKQADALAVLSDITEQQGIKDGDANKIDFDKVSPVQKGILAMTGYLPPEVKTSDSKMTYGEKEKTINAILKDRIEKEPERYQTIPAKGGLMGIGGTPEMPGTTIEAERAELWATLYPEEKPPSSQQKPDATMGSTMSAHGTTKPTTPKTETKTEKTILKKEVSKSTGKTRITYSDGTTEIL